MRDSTAAMSSDQEQPVTQLLHAMADGEASADASERLLELVYDELRQLARSKMGRVASGQTLQPTALVHEAYVRLVGPGGKDVRWDNRRHFFGAAAIAMRNILVDHARHRRRLKRGGDRKRVDLHEGDVIAMPETSFDMIELDEALRRLAVLDERKCDVVMLRFFAGLTIEDCAEVMEVSTATVDRWWAFARAWLHRELSGETDTQPPS